MRVCQINIFGEEGSTGSIVSSIHNNLLAKGHESYVFYGLGRGGGKGMFKIANDKLCRIYGWICKIIGLRFCCAYFETYYLLYKLKKLKPEIVHIHLMNSFYLNPYLLLHYLGRHNIKTIVTNHADIHFTANCDCSFDCVKWKNGCIDCKVKKVDWGAKFFNQTALSWKKMKKAFGRVNRLYITSVSEYTHKRALMSPFFTNCKGNKVIYNGIDTHVFSYKEKSQKCYDDYLNNKYKHILLHVTPNMKDPNKGFLFVKNLAFLMPDCLFLVVGTAYVNTDSLPSNILFLNRISNKEELSKIYSLCDVTLLTSRQESFSLVCAESLCCGTPVCGFRAGGPESIAVPDYTQFVRYGDVNALCKTVLYFLGMGLNKKEVSDTCVKVYSNEMMCNNYLTFYNNVIND